MLLDECIHYLFSLLPHTLLWFFLVFILLVFLVTLKSEVDAISLGESLSHYLLKFCIPFSSWHTSHIHLKFSITPHVFFHAPFKFFILLSLQSSTYIFYTDLASNSLISPLCCPFCFATYLLSSLFQSSHFSVSEVFYFPPGLSLGLGVTIINPPFLEAFFSQFIQ